MGEVRVTGQPYGACYAGLILQGELAGQYQLEPTNAQVEAQGIGRLQQELWLNELAPITIFVGANNSGKSRLLRGIFGDPKLITWFRTEAASEQRTREGLVNLFREFSSIITKGPDDADAILPRQQRVRLEQLIPKGWFDHKLLTSLAKAAEASSYSSCYEYEANPSTPNIDDLDGQQQVIYRYFSILEQDRSPLNDAVRRLEPRRCYIPMLRGMRPLSSADGSASGGDGDGDVYALRTYQDYFKGASWPSVDEASNEAGTTAAAFSRHRRIFSGLGIYQDIQDRLLSPIQAERDSIREYEYFLSEKFFQGETVTLTPALHRLDEQGRKTKNDVVHLLIGNSGDRPIHHLGDGMQSLIICTYPIITETQDQSLFFFEEPDLCMHPSLQRIFLDVLRDYHNKRGHQFFLTTHSNHLLDLLEDDKQVSIYSFAEMQAQATSQQAETTATEQTGRLPTARFRIRHAEARDRKILIQLGVRPSATYLANATIWVEGTTDRAHLRAYMNAFVVYLKTCDDAELQKIAENLSHYKEDRHYAFIEYSGNNLVHFSFIQAETGPEADCMRAADLCAHALVIADGDIVRKANRESELRGQLGDRLIMLPVKEIENLIPEQALHKQIEYDRAHKRERSTNQWPKAQKNDVEPPRYSMYATRTSTGDGQEKLLGIGHYLETSGFVGYKSKSESGTLKADDKQRWACSREGIPKRLRDLIAESANTHSTESKKELPPYLTQDLIWVCLTIFCHIAKANQDENIYRNLTEFRDWIRKRPALHSDSAYAQDNVTSSVSATTAAPSTPSAADHWPIPDPATQGSRDCLLREFLDCRHNSDH